MIKKNKVQENELKNVAGGNPDDPDSRSGRTAIGCNNCKGYFTFNKDTMKREVLSEGSCGSVTYKYECPFCHKWIDRDGNVVE